MKTASPARCSGSGWSLLALLLAVALISGVGLLARYYIGMRLIEWLDGLMMQVPLLNKFYGAIKQVNEAFAGNKHSFKTVVLVEFPREGMYSVGFLTSEQRAEVQQKTPGKSRCCASSPQLPIRLPVFWC